jgi:hypothetical protein
MQNKLDLIRLGNFKFQGEKFFILFAGGVGSYWMLAIVKKRIFVV